MLIFLDHMKSYHPIVTKNVQKMSSVHGSIILTINYSLQLRFPPHTSYTKFYLTAPFRFVPRSSHVD